ncbi:MAG TPA: periplasmic heavy metal sensor [Anaerolineae bacterium]|nr:periplasmic heavy metal sensor [Anaerolineae bacterium]
MSKKIKVMVFSSLLLNALLIGVIVGDLSHRFSREHFIGRHAELISKLPRDKAALFLKTVESVHLNNRNIYHQIREARKEAMKILAAPEFDEAAYRLKLKKLHELGDLKMQGLANATIELAIQFGQEERRALAQHLRHELRRPRDTKSPRNARTSNHENL